MLADDLLEIAPRRFTIKLLMSRSAAALPDNADAGTVLEVLQKKGAARRREIADKQKLGKPPPGPVSGSWSPMDLSSRSARAPLPATGSKRT